MAFCRVFILAAAALPAAMGFSQQKPAPPTIPPLPVTPFPVNPGPPAPPAPKPQAPAPPASAPPQATAEPVKPPSPARPDRPQFIKPKVPVPLFTQEKTALLEVECERIALFLARRAAGQYTPAVLKGDREASAEARLLLTVSLHLAPLNASAMHCVTCWSEGREPALPPPGEDLRAFSTFLLLAAKRQAGEPGSAREILGRVLVRLAADVDPKNEDAVYASEIQDRDGKAPPLRQLLEGTLEAK